MGSRVAEFVVGIFIIVALLALLFLAYRVSDFGQVGNGNYYKITAEFDNIGGLKVRAPVSVAGVKVGEIVGIALDNNNFRAVVTMKIQNKFNNLPLDTSANIFTQGILGSNYVSLSPGFEQASMKNGSRVETTHSALVLENLIGQLIYNLKSDSGGEKETKAEGEKKVEGTSKPSSAAQPLN